MKKIYTITKILILAFKVNKIYFALVSLATVLISLMPVLNTYLLAEIINKIASGNIQNASSTLILLVGFYIGALFFTEIAESVYNTFRKMLGKFDMTAYMTHLVNEKLLNLDIEFYENSDFTTLRSSVLDGLEAKIASVVEDVFDAISSILGFLFTFGAIVTIFPWESGIVLLSILPNIIVDYKMQSGLWSIWTSDAETRKKYGEYLNITRGDVHSKEIRNLGLGEYFKETLITILKTFQNNQKKLIIREFYVENLVASLPLIVSAVLIFNLANQAINGLVGVGFLSFFVSNLFSLKGRFRWALYKSGETIGSLKHFEQLYEFLNIQPKIVSKPNAIKLGNKAFSIEFKNVSFKYPNTKKYVFENFNLKINSKEKVAIVGENGSGKTTLIKLLMRIYDVNSGQILINGNDIKDIDFESLRKAYGVLIQDFALFKVPTIQENIGFGNLQSFINEEIDGEISPKIILESKNANAHEFISEKPKGYLENYGRNFDGVDFSGGEQQRIALARTFYRNSGLVILDEPTSAVDAKAEKEIFESLRKHLRNKTVLFISHRFSTVRNAERILVIENGQIKEDGSHEELIAAKGLYYKYFSMQAEGYK